MTDENKEINLKERKKARKLAMQALYQWHMNDTSISDLEVQFRSESNMKKVDSEYFSEMIHGIPKEKAKLDERLDAKLDRSIKTLTPVELTILRLGVYELIHRLDVPYKVVINEAVELAKIFGATDGHKFVNGVLDKIALQERNLEVNG